MLHRKIHSNKAGSPLDAVPTGHMHRDLTSAETLIHDVHLRNCERMKRVWIES
jgi:hypothetical protein